VRRLWITLLAAAVTAGLVVAVLWLGSIGFGIRERLLHQGRLGRLVEKHPNVEVVTRALEEEGTPLAGASRGPEELAALARSLGGRDAEEVLAEGRRFPTARVFRVEPGRLHYFLFFDERGALAGYALARTRYP
jgi:hypothetical protein